MGKEELLTDLPFGYELLVIDSSLEVASAYALTFPSASDDTFDTVDAYSLAFDVLPLDPFLPEFDIAQPELALDVSSLPLEHAVSPKPYDHALDSILIILASLSPSADRHFDLRVAAYHVILPAFVLRSPGPDEILHAPPNH